MNVVNQFKQCVCLMTNVYVHGRIGHLANLANAKGPDLFF